MKNLFLTLGLLIAPLALAHEVPCPFCGLKVVQATKTRDNEVVLRFGNKRIEYRCVSCALADAKRYDGELFVYAPSETKGKPVILQRKDGAWCVVRVVRVEGDGLVSAEAVFLNAFESHKECAALSRAYHTKAGFDKNAPKGATPLTLDAMLAKAGAK